jgi:hypothetical protein
MLLNSSSDREILREKFLKSFYAWEHNNDYQLEVIIRDGSPHILRQNAIRELGCKRPIIIVDDDMALIKETNYEPCIRRLEAEKTGIISTAWKRSDKTIRKIVPIFEKRKLVFTGGGMVISCDVQKIIIAMPNEPYWSDNVAWSVAIHDSGLQNYYYKGSIALHIVCQLGGRRSWIAKNQYVLPPGVVMRRGNKDSFLMPTERDLC